LELVILGAVAMEREPTYGYRIVQHLDVSGFGKIKGGTLYPILARLEKSGYIASYWGEGDGGPGRKFVTITPEGRDHLTRMATSWTAFIEIVGRLICGREGAPR
jgi:PadR family transcriptional regulator PadR